jgi:hypothetical protein
MKLSSIHLLSTSPLYIITFYSNSYFTFSNFNFISLSIIVLIKGVQYCIIGSFAPGLFQLYIGAIGVYSVIRLVQNIKKLEEK